MLKKEFFFLQNFSHAQEQHKKDPKQKRLFGIWFLTVQLLL
jgi:hypothetical protein